jgi:metal-responsive CopG/Arc/MetJ family transcriptional regulator
MVQVRLPVRLVKSVDHYAVDAGLRRSAAIERLLRDALVVKQRPV